MSLPYFSIVLATFNRAHLLPRALRSVLNQDFQDWELIVVDDGSTDESLSCVESFARKEPRIRLVKKEHSGLSQTAMRNEKARGAFYFLD
jgi:glycosyltransferase involved in cell wall biosynthesis